MTKILVLYFSMYGHIETMANAVAEGARRVPGTEVVVKRVPDLMPDEAARKAGAKVDQAAPIATVAELPVYDAIIFGHPDPIRQHVLPDASVPRPDRRIVVEGQPGRQGGQRVHVHGHPAWRPGDHDHVVPPPPCCTTE